MPNCLFCDDEIDEHYFTNSETGNTICMDCVIQLHGIILEAADSVNQCDHCDHCDEKDCENREVTKYDA